MTNKLAVSYPDVALRRCLRIVTQSRNTQKVILFPEVSPKCVQTYKLIEISQFQHRKGTTDEKPTLKVTETLTKTIETKTTANKPMTRTLTPHAQQREQEPPQTNTKTQKYLLGDIRLSP